MRIRGLMVVALAVSAFSPVWAAAQVRVGNDGQALDANNRVGSGGFNSRQRNLNYATPDQIATGNVTGGAYFRGSVTGDSRQFRGGRTYLPSEAFARRSNPVAPPGAPPLAAGTYVVPYYGGGAATLPPPGYTLNPLTGTYSPSVRSVRGSTDIQWGVPPGTPVFRAGYYDDSLVLGGNPALNNAALNGMMASPLLGVRPVPALSDEDRYLLSRSENINLSKADVANLDPAMVRRLRDEAKRNLIANPNAAGDMRRAALDAQSRKLGVAQPIDAQARIGSRIPNNPGLPEDRLDPLRADGAPGPDEEVGRRNSTVGELRDLYTAREKQRAAARKAAARTPTPTPNSATSPAGASPDDASPTDAPDAAPRARMRRPTTRGEGGGIDIPDIVRPRASVGLGAGPREGPAEPTEPAPPPPVNVPGSAAPESAAPGLGSAQPMRIKSLAAGQSNVPLRELLASAEDLVRKGKFASAVDRYDAAAAFAPKDATVLLGRAHAELGGAFYARADATLRAALATEPSLGLAKYELAANLGDARIEYLTRDLKQLATDSPRSARPVTLLAYLAYHTGDTDRAVKLVEEALRREPRDPLAAQLRAAWTSPGADGNK